MPETKTAGYDRTTSGKRVARSYIVLLWYIVLERTAYE